VRFAELVLADFALAMMMVVAGVGVSLVEYCTSAPVLGGSVLAG
jgi:hypothetical protein